MENKAPKTLSLDVEKYEHHLKNSNISEAEKQEFLETMRNIMCTFVQMGFGVESTQIACGKETDSALQLPSTNGNALESEDKHFTTPFNMTDNEQVGKGANHDQSHK